MIWTNINHNYLSVDFTRSPDAPADGPALAHQFRQPATVV